MIRILLPLICAALGFAAASCSQSEGPLAPAAEAPPPPHPTATGAATATIATPPDPQQQTAQPASDQALPDQAPSSDQASTTPASQSASDANPDVPATLRAERRASTLIGMPVAAADGSALGAVKDIIFDRKGRATHVVIAYGAAPQASPQAIPNDAGTTPAPDSKLTAMPWDAAMACIKGGRLVLDDAQLQSAPSFTPDAWPNFDDPSWSETTDAYWRKAVQAAIAAHPGAPVDSISRQRERPPRDGS
ncbi:MAG: PRC-barrel domain-containing protein [Steroidobacteraceae bacterium]